MMKVIQTNIWSHLILHCFCAVVWVTGRASGLYKFLTSKPTLGVLEHSSSCWCSNPNEGTLLLCISVYAVSVDVLTRAVDLHKTTSRYWALSPWCLGLMWIISRPCHTKYSLRGWSWIESRHGSRATRNLYSVGKIYIASDLLYSRGLCVCFSGQALR